MPTKLWDPPRELVENALMTTYMRERGFESYEELRDQIVTPEQAREIARLYLIHIDSMKSDFNVWHTSWAISNLYKLGDAAVKAELEVAYQKAIKQPDRLTGLIKNAANNHINNEKIFTGFIHGGGMFYAHGHLVVPGNKDFLQSYEEYREKEKK